MRIDVSNKEILAKVKNTIEQVEKYKKQLKKFRESVTPHGESTKSARIPSLLLTHFTGNDAAREIIQDKELKRNDKQYVSFTELNPFEFNTITQKANRSFGFGFFKEELIKQQIDLFVPMAFAHPDNHIELLNIAKGNNFQKYIVEPSRSGQPSIFFSNMLEIRSSQNVPLKLCRLFFREQKLKGQNYEKVLSDLGIFQLPHHVLWYNNYFLEDQKWFYKEESDCLVIHDTRSIPDDTKRENISADELIKKIEAKLVSCP